MAVPAGDRARQPDPAPHPAPAPDGGGGGEEDADADGDGPRAPQVLTLDPGTLVVTNSWSLEGESDLKGVALGGAEAPDEQEFSLELRKDPGSRSFAKVKFQCACRREVLACLYRALLSHRSPSPLTRQLLEVKSFSVQKYEDGAWQPRVLHLRPHRLEAVDAGTRELAWALDYADLRDDPSFEVLRDDTTAGCFAVYGRDGVPAHLFAAAEAEQIVREAGRLAEGRVGVMVTVELSQRAVPDVLAAAQQLDRSGRGAGRVGEWEVLSVPAFAGGAGIRSHRVLVTAAAVLERGLDTYEVTRAWALADLAAVVRFVHEPLNFALEFRAGPPAKFSSAERDSILAAVLDRAEALQGRCLPCLPEPRASGETLVVCSAAAKPGEDAADAEPWRRDLEVEVARAVLAALHGATREAAASVGHAAHFIEEGAAAVAAEEEAAKGSETQGRQRLRADSGAGGTEAERAKLARAMLRTGTGPCREAAELLRGRLAELNASLPYDTREGAPHPLAHVASKGDLDLMTTAILALLAPAPPPPPAPAPPPPVGAQEVHDVQALQGLMRLCRCHPQKWRADQATGIYSRLFGALGCGADAPATEAARVLAHLFGGKGVEAGMSAWTPRKGLASQMDKVRNLMVKDKKDTDVAAVTVEAAKYAKQVALQLGSNGLKSLLKPLEGDDPPAGALLAKASVEAVASVLCPPGKATTDAATYRQALALTSALGRPLFALFTNPSARTRIHVARVMQAIAEEGNEAAALLRAAALREGALLHHLAAAVQAEPSEGRLLSRQLVELWSEGYAPSLQLLERILPPGLYHHIAQRTRYSPPEGADGPAETDALQWQWFWHSFGENRTTATLIWDEHTRASLREALEREGQSLRRARVRIAETGGKLGWNHSEFEVEYPSLREELVIGNVYLRLLFEGISADADDVLADLPDPSHFFHALHKEFLQIADQHMEMDIDYSSGVTSAKSLKVREVETRRVLCLNAMRVVYRLYGYRIGPIGGLDHFVKLLDSTSNRLLRQKILLLIEAALCALEETSAIGDPDGFSPAPPQDPEVRARWRTVIKANARKFLLADGIAISVQFLAGVHGSRERPASATAQGNLLTDAAHAEPLQVWYVQAPGTPGAPPPELEPDAPFGLEGPLTKDELRRRFSQGTVSPSTLCWASGLEGPTSLGSVRELRWSMGAGTGGGGKVLGVTEVANHTLNVLLTLAALQVAHDADGRAIEPLPRAHRELCHKSNLPHLAQAVLCNEAAVVAAACRLLRLVLEHNAEALATLYRTGVFFFALAYAGQNYLDIAALLKLAHLKQAFHSASEVKTGMRLAGRSFLGGLIPEALLFALEQKAPAEFSEMLINDTNDPEIVWTNQMRFGRLIPQMVTHIGDLPRLLAQHNRATYEYTPVPPIGYPELDDEVWCHRYYLQNLCDIERFPKWPIVDRVELLQQILQMWREELIREPEKLTLGEAVAVMQMEGAVGEDGAGLTEDALKRAYRKLARLYHPDKNPDGREKFVEVQEAFEFLTATLGKAQGEDNGGPRPWRLHLFVKAQCILFARCAKALAPFKYAGYPLLLQEIQDTELEIKALDRGHSEHLATKVQLCWLTCVSSHLNGEELFRSGGLDILAKLLRRCLAHVERDVGPLEPPAVIASYTVRTLAGLAGLPPVQASFAGFQGVLVRDLVDGCLFTHAPALAEAAVRCCGSLAALDGPVQRRLHKAGILWKLLPLLFTFDATAEAVAQGPPAANGGEGAGAGDGAPAEEPADAPETPRSQAAYDAEAVAEAGEEEAALLLRGGLVPPNVPRARNLNAAFAARALATLGGFIGNPAEVSRCFGLSPSCAQPLEDARTDAAIGGRRQVHAVARSALNALLTPALADRLAEFDPRALIHDLNGQLEEPHIIWDSRMRAELAALCDDFEGRLPEAGTPDAEDFELERDRIRAAEAEECARWDGFVYEALKDEFVVGSVYIRVYNAAPTKPLHDAAAFVVALVRYLEACDVERTVRGAPTANPATDPFQRLGAALDALRNVLATLPKLSALFADPTLVAALVAALAPMPGLATVALQERRCTVVLKALTVMTVIVGAPGTLEFFAKEDCICKCFWIVFEACSSVKKAAADGGEGLEEDAYDQPMLPCAKQALSFLHSLARTKECAWAAGCQAGGLYLLSAILPAAHELPPGALEDEPGADEAAWRGLPPEGRTAAANLVGQLAAEPSHGSRLGLLSAAVLPLGLPEALKDGPGDVAAAAFRDYKADSPERVWTAPMAARTGQVRGRA